jgi:hypothetical protein
VLLNNVQDNEDAFDCRKGATFSICRLVDTPTRDHGSAKSSSDWHVLPNSGYMTSCIE